MKKITAISTFMLLFCMSAGADVTPFLLNLPADPTGLDPESVYVVPDGKVLLIEHVTFYGSANFPELRVKQADSFGLMITTGSYSQRSFTNPIKVPAGWILWNGMTPSDSNRKEWHVFGVLIDDEDLNTYVLSTAENDDDDDDEDED
ncbi:hypothetical protein ACFLU6_14525 [Acidobacteriota bacterium]